MDTPEKFRGGIFGKIMGQTLPVQTNLEASLPDQPAVPCNRFKMLPHFHLRITLLFYNYSTSGIVSQYGADGISLTILPPML
jgi:hypothetical protein